MYRAILAAASLAMISSAASAATLNIDDGSIIDFSSVPVKSTSRINVEFSLGPTDMDENVNFTIGPIFERLSGPKKTFFFDSVECDQIGIGLICSADAVFNPKSRKDFFAEFEISYLVNFEEIHDQEQPNVNEYSESFRVSLVGTGTAIAAVPLPASAWGLFSALGLLGWVARRRKAGGLASPK